MGWGALFCVLALAYSLPKPFSGLSSRLAATCGAATVAAAAAYLLNTVVSGAPGVLGACFGGAIVFTGGFLWLERHFKLGITEDLRIAFPSLDRA